MLVIQTWKSKEIHRSEIKTNPVLKLDLAAHGKPVFRSGCQDKGRKTRAQAVMFPAFGSQLCGLKSVETTCFLL